jgi:hypothetical protein
MDSQLILLVQTAESVPQLSWRLNFKRIYSSPNAKWTVWLHYPGNWCFSSSLFRTKAITNSTPTNEVNSCLAIFTETLQNQLTGYWWYLPSQFQSKTPREKLFWNHKSIKATQLTGSKSPTAPITSTYSYLQIAIGMAAIFRARATHSNSQTLP